MAVSPFLGHAAARLARVASLSPIRPREQCRALVATGRIGDDDLAAALIACTSPLEPVDLATLKLRVNAPSGAPQAQLTVANLAACRHGTDWPQIIARSVGLWAADRFDQGPGAVATRHRRGGLCGVAGMGDPRPDARNRRLAGGPARMSPRRPTYPTAPFLRAAGKLVLSRSSAPTAFHRLLVGLGGWAQHARWLSWQAEQAGVMDSMLTDLLAIRLIWEKALLAHSPDLADGWADVVRDHARPLEPFADQVVESILQNAAKRASQRGLIAQVTAPRATSVRLALQAVFCIDVRSEVSLRALERVAPDAETLGFAGILWSAAGVPATWQRPWQRCICPCC